MRIRGNKHGAVGILEDGIFFPSKGEHRRYRELKLLNQAGKIRELVVHPRYPIVYEGKKICDVVLDFEYYATGVVRGEPYEALVYEDFKGFQDAKGKLKHKLFEAFYNRKILITRAAG
jgi:hypothetical protein